MGTDFLLLAFAAVFLGGFVKGLSGFGYALVSTMMIASFFPVNQAVSFLIIPLAAIQVGLVAELESEEVKTCLNNFEVYIVSITAGTVLGFYLVSSMPASIVKTALGVVTLAFAASQTNLNLLGDKLKDKCFRRSNYAQAPLGMLSGLIFGSTNVGIQIVAYLRSMDLREGKFIGLLALVMIPVSVLRVPLFLGSSLSLRLLAFSVASAPIGILSAKIGYKAREHIESRYTHYFALSLLIIISINLLRSAPL